MDKAIQVIILVLSASSIWLINRVEKWSRWGFIIGLAAQPFWLYTTAKNDQWGFFILSIFYAYSWSMGIYNKWIKNDSTGNS